MRPRLAPSLTSGLSTNVMRALSNAGPSSIVSACRQIWVSLACDHHGREETKTQNRHKAEVEALRNRAGADGGQLPAVDAAFVPGTRGEGFSPAHCHHPRQAAH